MSIKIEILNKIALKEIELQYELDHYQLLSYSIGNDDRVYVLYAEKIPERIRGMFVPTISNTRYKALAITVDWYNEDVFDIKLLDFGIVQPNIHYMQKIEENYLLVGVRANYDKYGGQKNALIVNETGEVVDAFCLGDGIQQCIVDKENNILTSYFDEGIFGNNGWSKPIGECGLIKWSSDGKIIWQNDDNKHAIADCYAMNIDEQNNLWFYYYTEFILVKTNYIEEQIYIPAINGCSGFLLNESQTGILFDKGYNKQSEFCVKKFTFKNNGFAKVEDAFFCYEKQEVTCKGSVFRSSKAVLWDDEKNLYYTKYI